MKLRSLAVNQFKKFTSPTRLEGIEDGLNVVVGPNEMGKSTLLDALRAALFEKYSSRAQPIVARLCCKPDVGVSQIRTTTVLSSCFCVGQTVL